MNNTLLLITREGLGDAPHELQTILVINFFRNLIREHQIPETIFFYGNGIKLNTRGSVIEESLIEMEQLGTKILTCTTCLNYFGSNEGPATGNMAGMPDLIKAIAKSGKVVTL